MLPFLFANFQSEPFRELRRIIIVIDSVTTGRTKAVKKFLVTAERKNWTLKVGKKKWEHAYLFPSIELPWGKGRHVAIADHLGLDLDKIEVVQYRGPLSEKKT